MDIPQLWADVIQNVAKETPDRNEFNIILLLGSQVSINVSDNKIIFLCSSQYVYNLLPGYVMRFFREITRILERNNLEIDIKLVSNVGHMPQPMQMGAPQQMQPQQMQPQQMQPQQMQPQQMQPQQMQPQQMQPQQMMPQEQQSYYNNAPGSYAKQPMQMAASSQQEQRNQLPKFMREDHINPDKTFENYVTDPENELIFGIAKKVAADPGLPTTNPFYIYGGSGLGKTHLLFAIANEIRKTKPNVSVVYTRAEEFIRNYVESMSRKNSFDYQQVHFQDLYTQQNVFIVDDIQNFIKGPKARDTFFDIIADFLEKPNRQLILASDVPPGNLKDFSPRLKSRFGSGVCREIYPPSSETRAAITLKKCRELHIQLSDAIVQYIASHIRSNVREIEGAIKTLNSHILAYGTISYDEAVKSLANLVNVTSQITTVDSIKERVAKEFEVTVSSMESADRKKAVSTARSFAMTLASDLIPTLSLNDIGRAFNKDHSSVHEAIKRIKQRVKDDVEMAALYQKLTLSLKKE